ncbi:MAG: SDR family oxidoreductase [Bacteroidota bacterium]
MNLGLFGRVAFIAGASSGLGLATAKRLHDEGAHVAVCSRSKARIEAAAAEIGGRTDGQVLPLVCDVTDEAQIEAALAQTVDHFGRLHVLITNAGGPPSGFVGDFSADDWRRAIELNLMSTINLCRHALPHLREAAAADQHASVLMITSISAKQPVPNLYLSNTARAGVQGFAKSLSEEVGSEGITVNTILPGYTRTERLSELAEATHARSGEPIPDIEAGWAAATALKRLGEPDEFAAAAAFLVSKPAAFITGIGLPVDGGRTKGLL